MSNEATEDPAGERRPFAGYTSTDHARVQLAAELWSLASTCHQALIPEDAAGEGWPDAGIHVAETIMSAARKIMDAAVIAAYESGLTWEQIGRALGPQGQGGGITRQSAHAKYAGAVGEFHEQLIAGIDRAGRGEKPVDWERGPWPKRICDTAKYAPLLDTVATADYPDSWRPPRKSPASSPRPCPTRPTPSPPRSAAGSAAPTPARSAAGTPGPLTNRWKTA